MVEDSERTPEPRDANARAHTPGAWTTAAHLFRPRLKHGAHAWSERVGPWLRDLRNRVERDLDALVAVTGEEGSGKSTLALRLALRIDPNLDLSQIHNDSESFRHDAADRPEGSVLVLDEAFEGALNRQSQTRENVGFVKWLGEARALRHFMFICFPRFQNLDAYLRRHRVAYRVHVAERGQAEVYKTESDKFGKRDSWQRLVCRFRFGSLEDHPIWEPYQAQKKARIRRRDSELSQQVQPSGMTRSRIAQAVDENLIGYYEAARDMVANGHVRDLDVAAIELAVRTDQPAVNFHPNKTDADDIQLAPTGT